MKKLILLSLIGTAVVFAVVRKTNVCSYATTLVSQVERETKQQIPTKFELDRIRHEIASLDSDVSSMIRPIAEYKVIIEKMRKDIARSQANIDEQKKNLLAIVDDLKANPTRVTIGDKCYSADRVRQQLNRDLASVKQLEKSVKTQQQVLEAKETSLRATQEQLGKVISKKREYELRLAQLEADEETLQIARIGSDVKIDSSRATLIESALAELEHRHEVERAQVELRNGNVASIPLHERNNAPVDLQAIRNYLEGTQPAEKTASNE